MPTYGLARTGKTPTVFGLAYRRVPLLTSLVSISGLVAWYDFGNASTLFTDTARTTLVVNNNDPVGSATDLSTLGHHLSNTGATDRPLYQTNMKNSRSACLFDGSNDYLSVASFSLVQPTTVFAVFRALVVNSSPNAVFDGTGADSMELREGSGSAYEVYAGAFLTQTMPAETTSYHIISVLFNGGSSSVSKDNVNFASGNAGASNAGGLNLGRYGGGSRFLNISFAEFAVWNRTLNLSETASIQSYLNGKWAIY